MLLWNNLLSVLNALVYSVEKLDGFENGLLDDTSIINTTITGESRVHQYNQGIDGEIIEYGDSDDVLSE